MLFLSKPHKSYIVFVLVICDCEYEPISYIMQDIKPRCGAKISWIFSIRLRTIT